MSSRAVTRVKRAAVSVLAVSALAWTAVPASAAVPIPGWEPGKPGFRPAVAVGCDDALALTLRDAGFTGVDLREAWAISMRESRGNARAVSGTRDFGLFQFNEATWSGQDWWHASRLLTPAYNASVAYRLSDGGRTWYPWGLDGSGRVNAKAYRGAGWSEGQIREWIVEPYEDFYRQFPSECA